MTLTTAIILLIGGKTLVGIEKPLSKGGNDKLIPIATRKRADTHQTIIVDEIKSPFQTKEKQI